MRKTDKQVFCEELETMLFELKAKFLVMRKLIDGFYVQESATIPEEFEQLREVVYKTELSSWLDLERIRGPFYGGRDENKKYEEG